MPACQVKSRSVICIGTTLRTAAANRPHHGDFGDDAWDSEYDLVLNACVYDIAIRDKRMNAVAPAGLRIAETGQLYCKG